MSAQDLKFGMIWLLSGAAYGVLLACVFPGGVSGIGTAFAIMIGVTAVIESIIGMKTTPVVPLASWRARVVRGIRRGLTVSGLTACSVMLIGLVGAFLSQYLLAFGFGWFVLIAYNGPNAILSCITSAIAVEFLLDRS
jgi:hypothetical protein